MVDQVLRTISSWHVRNRSVGEKCFSQVREKNTSNVRHFIFRRLRCSTPRFSNGGACVISSLFIIIRRAHSWCAIGADEAELLRIEVVNAGPQQVAECLAAL